MACIRCLRGFTDECDCKPEDRAIEVTPADMPSFIPEHLQGRRREGSVTEGSIGISAGRKRAAVDYPLNKEHPCEWRGLKNCGGGKRPIVGCIDGLQQHRQHGPDKDTSNTSPGNVHRICAKCHNRWHTLNDPVYDRLVFQKLPHSPEIATLIELHQSEAMWQSGTYLKHIISLEDKALTE